MKRIISIVIVLSMLFSVSANALENTFYDLRARIYSESKEIKALMPNSKDIVVMSSIWDTCLVAMSQLDAYVSMVQLFNTIKETELTKATVNVIINWLNDIKATNDTNIKIITDTKVEVGADTRAHIEKLKVIFTDFNKRIEIEKTRLTTLRNMLRG